MNEIYKQKAEKYEYKFLKLKKQLEGGEIDHKLCKSIILTSKFLNLEVQEIYKSSRFRKDWKDYINELHTGKLVWGNPSIFTRNFKIIEQISNYKKYIEKLVYIGKVIKKNDLVDGTDKFNKICLEPTDSSNDIHIIIRRNVGGITFEEYFTSNPNITNKVFNPILKSLIDGIKNFIIPLYKKGYVLGNCDKEHMLINPNNYKVYFDYSLMNYNNHKGSYTRSVTQLEIDRYNAAVKQFEENRQTEPDYLLNNNSPIDPRDGVGQYNTKNSDVFGLCQFIKELFKEYKVTLSPDLNELINNIIINHNKDIIDGVEKLNKLVKFFEEGLQL